MLENKKMKWIIYVLLLALVVFAYFNYVEDWRNPKESLPQTQTQEYITAEVDTTISRRIQFAEDTVITKSTMQLLVAKMDSDSTSVNLDRPLQEVVTIDLEEHKDPLFFTWEDIKAYYQVTIGYIIDKYRNKHDNN